MSSPSSSSSAQANPRAIMSARFSLGLLLAINLFNYIDRYILAACEPLIAKDLLGENDPLEQTKMGNLAMAFMASYMITAPIFGWLAERFRRWTIIGIGVVLFSLASGLSGFSTSHHALMTTLGLGTLSGYTIMLLSRALVGVGEGAYGPLAPSLISDMFPIAKRGAVLSWFYVAIPVGSALGYGLGGAIASTFGWRWAFYAVVIPGILLGLVSFLRPEPKRGEADGSVVSSGHKPRGFKLSDLSLLIRSRAYVYNVLAMTAMTFAIGGVSFWMPRYVAVFRGATTLGSASFIFGAITASAGLLATLTGGLVSDRWRKTNPAAYMHVSALGMFIGFPLFLLVMFVPFPYCWGVIALAIFCLFFNTGPSNTVIANVTHASMRSMGFAVCIFMIHALGDAISPPIIGYISDNSVYKMNAGFAVVSVFILIAGVLWLVGAKYLAEDERTAQENSLS